MQGSKLFIFNFGIIDDNLLETRGPITLCFMYYKSIHLFKCLKCK